MSKFGKVTLRMVKHSVRPDTDMVEILLDGVVCATLVPETNLPGIKLISAHFAGLDDMEENGLPSGIKFMGGKGTAISVPILVSLFKVRPYEIEAGKLKPVQPN